MDHRVEAQLRRQFELLAEKVPPAAVCSPPPRRDLRQAVIIEPDLADRDHARTLRQRAQRIRPRRPALRIDFAGMNADRGPDVREIFGQLHRARARIDPRPDGNDLGHARVRRPRDHFRAVGIVVGVIEMGVGVDQHGEQLATKEPEKTKNWTEDQARDYPTTSTLDGRQLGQRNDNTSCAKEQPSGGQSCRNLLRSG
jgi:hypothetical protein